MLGFEKVVWWYGWLVVFFWWCLGFGLVKIFYVGLGLDGWEILIRLEDGWFFEEIVGKCIGYN